MKRIFYSLLIFFLPCILLVFVYVYLDPFKVIRDYDVYIDQTAPGRVSVNRDWISTKNFEKRYPVEKYNSFIFGNSRSKFYQVDEWKKHIGENASCYHFYGSSESLYALAKKIIYLDKKGVEIKNALLVLDYEILFHTEPKKGHLFIISPQLVNYRNIINFHFTFFKAFFSIDFLSAYIDFLVNGKIKEYMKKKYLLDDTKITYNPIANEIHFDGFEELIDQNKYYDTKKKSIFYERDTIQKYYPKVITENQEKLLTIMCGIFQKQKTTYKIIISPLYDQKKINEDDLIYLKNLFGSENVFDFSGINEFTNNYENYYETSHYRPHITKEIMNLIYLKNK